MSVRVVPFARIREILGSEDLDLPVADGTTVGDVWRELAVSYPALAPLANSTRLVKNGSMVAADTSLRDGDELCLLPPYGGG